MTAWEREYKLDLLGLLVQGVPAPSFKDWLRSKRQSLKEDIAEIDELIGDKRRTRKAKV